MMHVAIVGSRSCSDEAMVEKIVRRLIERDVDVVIVSGGAGGADRLAERVARRLCRREPRIFPADWSLGRGAGLARNTQIVEASDEIVALWDGSSRGTMDTVRKALAARKPTFVYHLIERRWLSQGEVVEAAA